MSRTPYILISKQCYKMIEAMLQDDEASVTKTGCDVFDLLMQRF